MDPAKRSFLKLAFFAVNGVVALLLSVPVLGYVLGPIFRKRATQWIEVGARDDFPEGEPKHKRLKYISTEGFREEVRTKSVWISVQGSEVIAFNSECTHVGCNVIWKGDRGVFFCPCHGGEFGRDGDVLAGPPPRPLDRLPIKEEEGTIFVEV